MLSISLPVARAPPWSLAVICSAFFSRPRLMLVMLWKTRADMFFSSCWTPILTRPTKRLPEPATNTTEQERVLEVTA
jgi:hypothetical protein